MRNRKKGIIVLVLLFLLLVAIFGLSLIKEIFDNDDTEAYFEYDYVYNNQNYVEKDNLKLILFVGLDSYDNDVADSYRNDMLADCDVLLVLNEDDKTILPIQINRDTMCDYNILGIGGRIAGVENGQLALSHSYGSGDIASLVNTKDAISYMLTNIAIDYYASLPMDAVSVVNDLAGGITVYVEDDFSMVDPSIIQGQENTLMGDQSLHFVRARQGVDDNTNLSRMNRQRVYLRALFEKCKTLVEKDSNFVFNTMNSISKYLIANTDVYGLSDLANTLLDYELLDAVQLKGEAKVGEEGYMEYILDKEDVEKFCIDTFYELVE